MTDLRATRWQKYGNDRLYVKDAADAPVGWVDLKTGAETLDRLDLAEGFREAIAAWRAANGRPAVPDAGVSEAAPAEFAQPDLAHLALPPTVVSFAPPISPAPAPPAPPADPRGRDLSLHRPGEVVRAKAEEEWQVRKDRSRFWAYTGRILDVNTDERAWRVGAAGEEKVGPKLEKLIPHGWRVLHSVPVGSGDSDIDHVLIGPGGVFTINTKFHPGARVWVGAHQIRVSGQPVPYLRNSRFEGQRAAKILSAVLGWEVPVRPALVILTGGFEPNITYKQQPDDVLVLDIGDLPRVFKKRTGVLGHEAVAEVFEVARWERTWVR